VVGLRLGHACGDRPYSDLGDELDANVGERVCVLQVVDELGEVLDGVDIVVWRGGDQTYPRRRVADLRDVLGDFMARELAALARLRALGHFYLQDVGVDEVLRGDAEAPARDLFDGAAAVVAVRVDGEARRVLSPLAGVGLPADAVHGDG
jgi:hypothetical protein